MLSVAVHDNTHTWSGTLERHRIVTEVDKL